ncbi:ABC transporter family protein, partial [Vibrio parahaemolyticus V-223/04]
QRVHWIQNPAQRLKPCSTNSTPKAEH